MELTDTTESNIVSVVDEFDYSTQNESYNEHFRNWRKNKDNPFAFSFERNLRESVFIDGRGFESKSAATAETETLSGIMNIIGTAMLIWIVIDNLFSKVFVGLFDLLGFDIHGAFFSTAFFGGSVEIVTALIVINIVKICIPAVYLHYKLKLPRRVEFMTSLNHPTAMFSSLFMTLAMGAITSIPNIYTNRTRQIYNYFKTLDADVSVWGQEEFIVYAIFDIIIISILGELFFRGAMFPALRQFGDTFAIIVTSAIAGLLSQDIREFPAAVMISATAAAGMLRSGSIFTAFFVQILFKIYRLSLILLESSPLDNMFLKRNTFILTVFIIGAAGFILLNIIQKIAGGTHLARYYSEIPISRRLVTSVKVFPVSAVAGICLLAALMKIIF